jgi:MFS family permease
MAHPYLPPLYFPRYPRRQVQKRLSFFYTLSILATGLSSILAYGLAQLDGEGGLSGWRWIFLVEGLMTVLLGLVGYVAIIDFPDKAKMLNAEERAMILERIQRDRADAIADKMTLQKFIKYVCDWKLWIFAFMFFSSTCCSYALSYFLPAILAGMGFDAALSQILVAPPYVYAIIPAIFSAVMSDKTQIRSVWIMGNALFAVMGLALFSYLPYSNTAGRYAGIFLAAGGANANVPLIIGWAQISIRAQSCRAYTSALVVAFGGIGGIVSALVFRTQDAPSYPLGIAFTIAVNALTAVFCVLLSTYFRMQNRKADRHGLVLEEHKDFRYQL